MKNISLTFIKVLFLGIVFLFSNCKKKEEIALPPSASDAVFSQTIDSKNPNVIHLKYTGKEPAWYIYWDLGNKEFAEGATISKFFLQKGTYKIRMKIFTKGGTAETTQDVVINQDFKGENLLKGGDMQTGAEANWTILKIANNENVSWKFNNGSATAISSSIPTGDGNGHQGIYQAVQVVAGKKYKFDARVFGSGAANTWFEIYINAKAPEAGKDYGDKNAGNPALIGLSTWGGCGTTAFDGKLSLLACNDNRTNEIVFKESGTVYFVIKTGTSTGNLGATGISITNIEFYAID